jgi:hypothetical protein
VRSALAPPAPPPLPAGEPFCGPFEGVTTGDEGGCADGAGDGDGDGVTAGPGGGEAGPLPAGVGFPFGALDTEIVPTAPDHVPPEESLTVSVGWKVPGP